MKGNLPPVSTPTRFLAFALMFGILLFTSLKSSAQTNLYTETFNSGGSASWTLNATDMGSDGANQNYWVINNIYSGDLTVTPDEPAGITGYPESYYMHITNGDNSGFSDFEASFFAPATGNVFTKMNTAIVTTSYTGVTLTFWYLCNGGNVHYTGRLYYSIDGGTNWIQEGGTYSGVSNWTMATITDPAFDNVADLRFAFMWVQTGAGGLTAADPSWAVDDINVVGTGSGSCAIVINSQTSTNPTCSDSTNGTITITATDTGTLTYTINGGSPISNGTGVFTNLPAGTYTVSVANSSCSVSGANITLTSPAAVPSPTASNNGPLCVGDALQLSASTVAGATYSWTGPNSFGTQNPGIGSVALTDSGVYTVVAIVGGCQSAPATTDVAISPPPATPMVSNNGPLCEGDMLQLTSSSDAGASYSWTGPNSFNIQNPSIASTVITDSGTYTVVASIGSCTSGPATTTVIINPSPTLPIASSNAPLCVGDSLQLNASSSIGATYSWTGPNSFSIQNPDIPSVAITDSGVYTVIATLGSCNSAAVTVDVIISPPPAAPVVSNNGPLCEGTTLTLSASDINGASYSWTGPNSFNVQNPSIPSVTLSDAGTYTVVASIGSCSSGPASTTVVVNPSPAPPTTANNGPLCEGDSMVLTASDISGATYSWTGPNNFNIQDPGLGNVTIADSGTYTVVATVAGCNSIPVSTTVIITVAPTAPTATNNGPLCVGDNLQLNASDITGATYAWTGPNSFNIQNPVIGGVAITDSGTYTVIASIGSCSSAPATTVVIISPPPAAPSLSSNSPVCEGSELDLFASDITGASYSWTGPNSFNQQNPVIPATSISDGGTYTVVVSIGSCSSAPTTIDVTINPAPVAPAVSSNSPVCAGDTLQLTAGNVSGATYSWTGPNSFNVQNPSLSNVALSDSGTYSLVIIVGGCSSTAATTDVSILPAPTAPTPTESDSIICPSDSAQICITGSFTTYLWNTGSSGSCIYTSNAGNYYATVTDANGCTVSSTHIGLNVFASPSVSIAESGDTLSCNTATSYQWYLNGNAITGATTQIYVATQNGNYSVAITDSNGCVAISNEIVFTTGIQQLNNNIAFDVYPNPVIDKVVIEFSTWNTKYKQLEMFDVSGRKVAEIEIEGSKTELNVSQLASGVYMLRIGGQVRRFVKE